MSEPMLNNSYLKYSHLGWSDEPYQKFMKALLLSLEPRYSKVGEILINENQEGLEVIFIEKGEYMVGFEINKEDKRILKFQKGNIIGGYECTFNKRSIYKY
jgi:hypothetical protein